MKIGYAWVSTHKQIHDLQIESLEKAGCTRVYTGSGSVACVERPLLQRLCEQLRRDDVRVIWKLDRLGRGLADPLAFVGTLEANGVQFASLTEWMNTTTFMGQLVFQIFGVLAEYDRNLIRERTLAGLAAARAWGRRGGRPKLTGVTLERAAQLMRENRLPIAEIARIAGVSRSTIYRHLRPDGSFRSLSDA